MGKKKAPKYPLFSLTSTLDEWYPKVLSSMIEGYLYRPEEEDVLDMVTVIVNDINRNVHNSDLRFRRAKELCGSVNRWDLVDELDAAEARVEAQLSPYYISTVRLDVFSLMYRAIELARVRPWIFWPNFSHLHYPEFYKLVRKDTADEWLV